MTTAFTFAAVENNETLALDASAGTGKTHTLTTIALRLIANGQVTIEQLLVVTFTNAATAELKLRLLATLRAGVDTLGGTKGRLDRVSEQWLCDADTDTLTQRREHLQAAVMAFDDASIVTIHGFCQRMLTFVGVSAGMSVDAAVTDDDDSAKNDTLDDLTASLIASRPVQETAFLTVAAKLSRDNISTLATKVLQLAELRLTDDRFATHTFDSMAALHAGLDDVFAIWTDALAHARTLVPDTKDGLAPLVTAFLNDPYFSQESSQRTYTPKQAGAATEALATFFSRAQPTPPATLKKVKRPEAEFAYLWFTQAALDAAPLIGPVPENPLTTACELLATAHNDVITQARNLIAHAIHQRYQTHRINRQVLTYDDLLQQLHQALTDPQRATLTRTMLRTQYTMALIDEFQDTDAVQWEIFAAVFSPADPLIVIGDPKQAIYQFRGADVATYLRARDTMRQIYTLDTNWRSDQAHVGAINALFGHTEAFAPYGITYNDTLSHHDNRLVATEVKSGMNVRALADNGDSDARVMARIIDDMAAHAVTLLATTRITQGDDTRPITPRDIAVLVLNNRRARHVQAAFAARGVPATIQRGGSVYATDEAAALHQLLAAMANPHDLLTVCGAAASQLIQMPLAVLAAIQDDTATVTQQNQFASFMTSLVEWQTRWDKHGVFAAIMAATGTFAAVRNAEQVIINVRHLAELLQTAQHDKQLGVDSLVAWFAQQRASATASEYRADRSDELRLGADDDAVRIATVHGAKGLEYPIVFSGDLWFKSPQPKPGLIAYTDPHATPHPKPTLDLSLPINRSTKSRPTLLAERDSKAEQVRIAYVALTRAAHATVLWCPTSEATDLSPLGAVLASLADGHTYPELLHSIATQTNAAIDSCQVTDTGGQRYAKPVTDTTELTTRTQHRTRFDTAFRHTSFTALTRNNPTHASVYAVSRSQGGDDDRDGTHTDVPTDVVALPLGAFPRGTRAGNLLHSVYEQLDFVSATTAQVTETLATATRTNRFAALDMPAAVNGIIATLGTPLGAAFGDATLRQIPRNARADEMGFTIPLANDTASVTVQTFIPVLAASREPLLNRLATRLGDDLFNVPTYGFLSGSIDALLRLPCGRYAVVDYKSNYIGDQNGDTHLACYQPTTALVNTMSEHLYTLQALLYLVVTHRYLNRRVAGYNPDTHLAGAAYLFLRGMIGPDTPSDNGQRYGVATLTPEPELLDEINALLAAKTPQ